MKLLMKWCNENNVYGINGNENDDDINEISNNDDEMTNEW